jgi:cell division protein FtsI/penicillin-binding protein 2
MGVILNNGVRQAIVREQSIHFAGGTPYETVLEPEVKPGETVMDPHVAAALHGVLLGVVQHGTATSLNGLFHAPDGSLVEVGGKTGSGDNRFETFNRGGGVRTSRAVSRTGTFVFYIGTRYFGVITAYVGEEIASRYGFTSALPVAVLRQLAPAMTPLLGNVPRK